MSSEEDSDSGFLLINELIDEKNSPKGDSKECKVFSFRN